MTAGLRPRLLVVDDHMHNCQLLLQQLRDDYEVEVATSFENAVEKATGQVFAAAILDSDLGEARSGIDLLHAVRRIPHHAALPALACSAQTLANQRIRLLAEGFNSIIGKPFRRDQLLATVADMLAQHDREQKRPSANAEIELSGRRPTELDVPPLPNTFAEVVQLLARTETVPDTDRLIEILGRDTVAVSWVLRHINSAYYSFVRKISSIDRAVGMLGFDPVCNLVLTQVLTRTFSRLDSPKSVAIYRHVMRMSAATAAFARLLAYHINLPQPEIAFTAGLLHQLGRLALLSSDSRRYVKLWEELEPRPGETHLFLSLDREFMAYGSDYPRIGADIGRAWQLPEDLLMVIRYHLDLQALPQKDYRLLVLVVAAGREAASDVYEPGARRPALAQQRSAGPSPTAELAREVRLRPERLREFLRERQEDVRRFADSVVLY